MSRSSRFFNKYGEHDDSIEKRDRRINNLKREQKRLYHKRLKASRRSWRRFKHENDNGSFLNFGRLVQK